jgi:hypothetical protein
MRIYFDENFSSHLVAGMKAFQEGRRRDDVTVFSVEEEFGRGTPDETWIPAVAKAHGVALTQDTNIHRARAQWELCQGNKIGVFFFKPPKDGWTYWRLIQLVVRLWPEITRLASETKRPFGYVVDARKTKIQAI